MRKGVSVASIRRVTRADCICYLTGFNTWLQLSFEWLYVPFVLTTAPAFYINLSVWLSRLACCAISGWYPNLFKEVWGTSTAYKTNFEKTARKGMNMKKKFFSETGSFFRSYCFIRKILFNSRSCVASEELPRSTTPQYRWSLTLIRTSGIFRRHLMNFGKIAKPLYDLLKEQDIKDQVIPPQVIQIFLGKQSSRSITKLDSYNNRTRIVAFLDFELPLVLHVEYFYW